MNKAVTIDDNLIELMKSITNRCVIFELIKDEPLAGDVVATLVEDMFADCQEVIKYCVVE